MHSIINAYEIRLFKMAKNQAEKQLLIAVHRSQAIAQDGHKKDAEQFLEDARNKYAGYAYANNIELEGKVWRKAEKVAFQLLQAL